MTEEQMLLSDEEIDMKMSGVQPSPDFTEYRRRMVRAIEPLIRFKEMKRVEPLIRAEAKLKQLEANEFIRKEARTEAFKEIGEWLEKHSSFDEKLPTCMFNGDFEKLIIKLKSGIKP